MGKARRPMPVSVETFAGLPPIPIGSAIERLPYDEDALAAIGRELGQPIAVAPFRIGTAPVYRLVIPITGAAVVRGSSPPPVAGEPDQMVTTVTLWTSLGRVDLASHAVSIVTTGIVAVDLVPEIEVIFRHAGGSMTVARNGWIMVRTGESVAVTTGPPAPE